MLYILIGKITGWIYILNTIHPPYKIGTQKTQKLYRKNSHKINNDYHSFGPKCTTNF